MKNFILFFLINLLVHLPFINLPPCGTHVWRQCNTLAMSRNFSEEGMNILEPKIDRRNESNGITGSHFPLYEWLLAACSKLFGFSDGLARIFSLLISSFALFAFYKLFLHFNISDLTAKMGTLLLLSIPELYYHSINAMPDILALTLALFGLYYWLKYQKNNSITHLSAAIIFSLAGGLVKFQFLMIPLAAIVLVPFIPKPDGLPNLTERKCDDLKTEGNKIRKPNGSGLSYTNHDCTGQAARTKCFLLKPICNQYNLKTYLKYACFWIGIFLIVFTWYYYATQLTKTYNLKEYGLWITPIPLTQKLLTIRDNLIMDFPEVLLGWPLLIGFLFILSKSIRTLKPTPVILFGLVWFLMFASFYIVAIERMKNHSYYFMPLLPLLVLAFIYMTKRAKIKTGFIMAVLILNFLWTFVRIIPARWVEAKMQIPIEFSNPALRQEFTRTIPPNSKCIVGPDISGCIYFYFTHTKGYSFEYTKELVTMKNSRFDIENMRAAGMKYLIIKDGGELQPYLNNIHLKRKIKTIGTFEIWEL